jgi:signal peptidase I
MPLLDRSQRLISREFRIHGSSMEPAFQDGSMVRISPVSYLWRTPRREEVVGLRCPDAPDRFELKRIVGLPGECVSWIGSNIWIHGNKLEEPYAHKYPHTPGDELHMLDLGPGEYFVAGDNRLYSLDSRNYGPVWLSDILGRVVSRETLVSHTYV